MSLVAFAAALAGSPGCGASDASSSPAPSDDDPANPTGQVEQRLVSGERPLLVILLEKPGTPFAHDDDWYRRRVFGGGGERNVRDYFLEASLQRFTFSEAGVVHVVDDPSLDKQVGATDPDSLQRQRMRARYLAAQAGFDFKPFDANGNRRVDDDELTIIAIDSYSDNAGQTRAPACSSLSGVSVCSSVAAAGHRGSLKLWAHELSHTLGTVDLYGARSNSKFLTLMSSHGAAESTDTTFLDPWHRNLLGWKDRELVRAHTSPSIFSLGYQGNTNGKRDTLKVTTTRNPSTGVQESLTFEGRARLSPYDDDPNVGLYAWYAQLDSNNNPIELPGIGTSIFVLAPTEGCTLAADDLRGTGRSAALNFGQYAWHWSGGVITFDIQPDAGGFRIGWTLGGGPRHCEGSGVTAFEGTGFTGSSQSFGVGTWSDQTFATIGNDTIGSLRVDSGYTVRACTNPGATGTCRTFRGSTAGTVADLGAINDAISYLDVKADRFVFSNAGPINGYKCISVNESADPDTWDDNYFCSSTDEGMQWSSAGPIAGMSCIQIAEAADPNTWDDNYLCFAGNQYTRGVQWSSAGPILGRTCVQWNEPSDPDTWDDNFFCYDDRPRFVFSYAGPVAGYHCISVNEPADADTWGDNYFCSLEDEGMQWSSAGPISGMSCVQISESADPDTWDDNYLCFASSQATRNMQWGSAGPAPGKTCVQWTEPADPHTWDDNYLCY